MDTYFWVDYLVTVLRFEGSGYHLGWSYYPDLGKEPSHLHES